jgi:tRNA 2-thiouridine synthesizing protein A
MTMLSVDVRGLSCPLPVMRTQEALGAGWSGDNIEVLADSGTAKANVAALLEESGFDVSVESDAAGDYRILGNRR